MRSIRSWLFVGGLSKEDERSWKASFTFFAPFFFFFFLLGYHYKNIDVTLYPDGHLLKSLDRAYQKVFCGKHSHKYKIFSSNSDISKPINTLLQGPTKTDA